MNRTAASGVELGKHPRGDLAQASRRVVFGLFLAGFLLVWVRLWLPTALPGRGAGWPEGLLLVLGTADILLSLSRQLPGQNVLLAAAVVLAIGSLAEGIGVATGIPLGPFVYAFPGGGRSLILPRWAPPLLELSAILTARGAGRFILRRWRTAPNYGFRLMGLTLFLVLLLQIGFGPIARRQASHQALASGPATVSWLANPWFNLASGTIVTLCTLVLATPTLINKRPVEQPPDVHPLIVLVLVGLLLAAGAIKPQF